MGSSRRQNPARPEVGLRRSRVSELPAVRVGVNEHARSAPFDRRNGSLVEYRAVDEYRAVEARSLVSCQLKSSTAWRNSADVRSDGVAGGHRTRFWRMATSQ